MASRSSKAREFEHRRRINLWIRWSVGLAIVVAVALAIRTKRGQPLPTDQVTQASGTLVVNQDAIHVQEKFKSELDILIHDQRYPVRMRLTLSDMVQRNLDRRLQLDISTKAAQRDGVLAWSDLMSRQAIIHLQMERFLLLEALQRPDELFRNSLGLIMYHEMVHQEIWPIKHPLDHEQKVSEEARAYARTILDAMRPMRLSGMYTPESLQELDDVLASCGDRVNCPAFRQAIAHYIEQ